MEYAEFNISFSELEPWRDIVVAELAEIGFESFVETKMGVLSYIPVNEMSPTLAETINSFKGVSEVSMKAIPTENWNQKWEDNFEPVYVDDKLAIIAPFHKNVKECQIQITIQPQMSFGTGHHQTTWLISQRLFNHNLKNKTVLDMGTGTGVLAILVEKLGARNILAPDIDEWSYKNAQENAERNNCKEITVLHGGHEGVKDRVFDLVIANINKNILIENFSVYSGALASGGKLILSGFFSTDNEELKKVAELNGFVFEGNYSKDEWSVLEFNRK